jgi:hypothetical protein
MFALLLKTFYTKFLPPETCRVLSGISCIRLVLNTGGNKKLCYEIMRIVSVWDL